LLLAHSLVAPVPVGHVVLASSLLGVIDWFAVGIGLAVLAAEWEVGGSTLSLLRRLAHRPALCWLLAAILFAVGVPAQHGDQLVSRYGVWTHLAIALAAGALVLPAVVRGGRRGPIWLLTRPAVAWLGTISYGIYLWHQPIIETITNGWEHVPTHQAGLPQTAGLLVAALVGAVALGAASWYLVERPAQRRWRAPRRRIIALAD
jgi:peptidoglycan/LPS O-acetylase OafA/YrhL